MKEKNWKSQGIAIASMLTLLTVSYLFDTWLQTIQKKAGTFDPQLITQRLWAIPVATLIFAILALALYRILQKQNSHITAVLFFITGSVTLFYPTIIVAFKLSTKQLPMPDYFSDTTFYYLGAWIAASGCTAFSKRNNHETELLPDGLHLAR